MLFLAIEEYILVAVLYLIIIRVSSLPQFWLQIKQDSAIQAFRQHHTDQFVWHGVVLRHDVKVCRILLHLLLRSEPTETGWLVTVWLIQKIGIIAVLLLLTRIVCWIGTKRILMLHAQAGLHRRLLPIYLECLVKSSLVQVGHVITRALKHATLITEFGMSGGSLMLLWDQVSRWSVVTVYINVKSEIEGTWYWLVMLCACRRRSWRGLVEDRDEHRRVHW